MQINFNQVSFTAKIEFISKKEFEQLPLSKMISEDCYASSLIQEKRIKIGKKGITQRIRQCCGGGFHNFISTLIFHIPPDQTTMLQDAQKLESEVMSLKNQKDKVFGLLIGGADSVNSSIELFDLLRFSVIQQCPKSNISTIWGQKYGGETDVCCFMQNNECVWKIYTQKKAIGDSGIESFKDLIDTFKIIKISNHDRLYINHKLIKKSEHPEIYSD